MSTRSRLHDCFAAVFPSLEQSQIEHATTASLEEWDSLATVRLVAVIEEEFDVELELDELEELDSFDRIHNLLEAKLTTA